MNAMGSALIGVDGFAIHTGDIRSNDQDPRGMHAPAAFDRLRAAERRLAAQKEVFKGHE